jgi:hypothetical protein
MAPAPSGATISYDPNRVPVVRGTWRFGLAGILRPTRSKSPIGHVSGPDPAAEPWLRDVRWPRADARDRIRHVPVLKNHGLLGILTDRDLKRTLDPELGLPPRGELFVRGNRLFLVEELPADGPTRRRTIRESLVPCRALFVPAAVGSEAPEPDR